jgi:alkylglycerol monooxygenase
MESNYTLLAIPAFLLLVLFEWLVMRHKKKEAFRLNDTVTNLNLGIGNVLMNAVTKTFLLGVYIFTYEHFRVFTIETGIWSWIICLIALDFFFYWAHRLSHEINFLWGAHVVHHQSEYYNLSVALRQSWFHNLLAFFIFLPVPVLGIDPITFFTVLSVNSFFQFWIHTEAIKKLPRWFEFIFNTPAHHRVHHGVNPKYIDKNHAGMFIIWDRMFGTFREEEETPTYGITKPLQSWNPVWANVHYYVEMFQSARLMHKWKDKLKIIFARPGWLPVELGGYQAPPEVDKAHYNKYTNITSNKGLHMYVLVQLIFTIAGLSAFLFFFSQLSTFYIAWAFSMIILTVAITGGIMEQKQWVKYAEYVRLLLVVVGLNSLYFFTFREWFEIMLAGSILVGSIFVTWFTLDAILEVRRKTIPEWISERKKPTS